MKKPEKKDETEQDSLKKYFGDIRHNRGYNESCDDHKAYFKYLLSKIPSDKLIEEYPCPNYARKYYQGKFDLLMNLLGTIKDSK